MMSSLLARFRISTKISAVVGVLAVTAAILGTLGIIGMKTYDSRVDEIQNLSQRALLSEQVNSLVYKVVMDSRGIYAAESKDEARAFATAVTDSTALMAQRTTDWKALVPPDRVSTFQRLEKGITEFIQTRNEAARLGVEVGPAEAEKYGGSDASRANRKALGEELEQSRQRNMAAIQRDTEELDAYRGSLHESDQIVRDVRTDWELMLQARTASSATA